MGKAGFLIGAAAVARLCTSRHHKLDTASLRIPANASTVRRAARKLAWTILATIALTVAAIAQTTNARLDGTVQDPSGAVIPSAHVEAVNTNTQARAETTTDSNGNFV